MFLPPYPPCHDNLLVLELWAFLLLVNYLFIANRLATTMTIYLCFPISTRILEGRVKTLGDSIEKRNYYNHIVMLFYNLQNSSCKDDIALLWTGNTQCVPPTMDLKIQVFQGKQWRDYRMVKNTFFFFFAKDLALISSTQVMVHKHPQLHFQEDLMLSSGIWCLLTSVSTKLKCVACTYIQTKYPHIK